MNDPKHPLVGELAVNAGDVAVIDVTSTKIRKLVKLRPGHDAAIANLAAQTAAMLTRAGIDAAEVKAAVDAMANVTRIEELLPATKKLYELLRETYLVNRNQVGAMLNDAHASAKRRAKRDPNGDEILASLEPLFTYVEGPAKKGVATKIKSGKLKPRAAKAPKMPA